jgi:hypothetical protein
VGQTVVALDPEGDRCLVLALGPGETSVSIPEGRWTVALDSNEDRWGGRGASAPEGRVHGGRPLAIRGHTALLLVLEPSSAGRSRS